MFDFGGGGGFIDLNKMIGLNYFYDFMKCKEYI